MKVSQLMTPVVASLIVVTLAGPMRAQTGSQAAGCAEVDWTALQPSAPAYVDALELARTLADSGLMVLCIGGSKMTGMFEGQKGEAIYRTDQGRFDVAFLPKPQNFDGLQIVERVPHESAPNPENIRYLRAKRERMGHLLSGLDEVPEPASVFLHRAVNDSTV